MRGADFAVELTQAELQMAHGQLEQSLATLMHLRSISPKHTHVLFLLMQIYKQLKSWVDLKALLPELRKNKIINQQQFNKLEKKVWFELLSEAIKTEHKKHLDEYWQQLPHNLRRDEDLVRTYAMGLITQQAYDRAERILREALKRSWMYPLNG